MRIQNQEKGRKAATAENFLGSYVTAADLYDNLLPTKIKQGTPCLSPQTAGAACRWP
jgi:hypothetical protein